MGCFEVKVFAFSGVSIGSLTMKRPRLLNPYLAVTCIVDTSKCGNLVLKSSSYSIMGLMTFTLPMDIHPVVIRRFQ